MPCAVDSFGKINLFLQVVGQRPDGYHQLETLFLPLAFPCDRIAVEWDAPGGLTVKSDDPTVPDGPDNLIWKAASGYAERAKLPPNWHFFLGKQLPVAAGLGGGSGNAGRVLQLLEQHYGALGEAGLRDLARTLGADVPFFLSGRAAWASGIGDELTILAKPVKTLSLVLVNPGFPVGVKWAYRQLDAGSFAPVDPEVKAALLQAYHDGDARRLAGLIRNDLAPALWRKFPLLVLLRRTMLSSGALAVEVSGSGSTLFAVTENAASAKAVASAVRCQFAEDRGIRVWTTEGKHDE